MFLGMQILIFTHTESNFIQILSKIYAICPIYLNFTQICLKNLLEM